jgi:hypothetical protein
LLRLEGILTFLAAVAVYGWLGASWGLFALLLLAPDVFMAGYLAGPRLGAHLYNVGHTYVLPAALGAAALWMGGSLLGTLALIWIAHIGMDRALGYGLKSPSGFHDTHLSPVSSSPDGSRTGVPNGALVGMMLVALGLSACQMGSSLEAGRWSGTLTPMNHPEMATSIAYDVRYGGEGLAVDLIGPGGASVPTDRPQFDGDTLRFAFEEPDAQVRLSCVLGRERDGYAGRCTDPGGKWARFTMVPPSRP